MKEEEEKANEEEDKVEEEEEDIKVDEIKEESVIETKNPMEILDEIYDKGLPQAKNDIKIDQNKTKLISEIKHKKRRKPKKVPQPEDIDDPNERFLIKNEDLKPFPNPEFYIDNILMDLKINDWQLQFESLNNLRRIIKFHIELIYNQDFSVRTLIRMMTKVLNESGIQVLTRNCLFTFKELIESLKKIIDFELEDVFDALLHKAAESSLSLKEMTDIKECLGALFEYCSEEKCIEILSRFVSDPQFSNKIIIPLCLEKIIVRAGNKILTFNGISILLKNLVLDMSNREWEIRRIARRAFFKMIESGIERKLLENFFKQCLPYSEYVKFADYMERTDKIRKRNVDNKNPSK